MDMIKKHLYYVIMVAAMLAGLGLVIAWGSSKNGDKNAELQPRESLMGRISSLTRGEKINDGIITNIETSNQKTRQQVEDVVARGNRFNSEHFLKMLLTYKPKENESATPVFPVDRARLYNEGTFEITQGYLNAMKDLLEKLQPTAPPTEEELRHEIARQVVMLQGSVPAGGAATPSPAPAAPIYGGGGGMGAPGGGMGPPGGGMGADMSGMGGGMGMGSPTNAYSGGTAGPSAEVLEKARRNAESLQLISKARAGRIYVLPGALDHAGVDIAVPNKTVEDLWRIQLNLWVQSDLVAAISETNEQAAAGQKGSVETSAVKQLLRIEVGTNYETGTGAPGASTATPAADMGGMGASIGGMGPPGGGMGAPAGGMGPAGGGGSSSISETTGGAALTGRVCDPQRDVVRYAVDVVMPMRHVNALIQNILKRNFHTILSIQAEKFAQDSRMYFGTDPVMHVTIRGELLMLTAWERGEAVKSDAMLANATDPVSGEKLDLQKPLPDDQKKTFENRPVGFASPANAAAWDQWDDARKQAAMRQAKYVYLPLMPAEVLNQIGARDSSALRPQDVERKDQEMSTAGGASSVNPAAM